MPCAERFVGVRVLVREQALARGQAIAERLHAELRFASSVFGLSLRRLAPICSWVLMGWGVPATMLLRRGIGGQAWGWGRLFIPAT